MPESFNLYKTPIETEYLDDGTITFVISEPHRASYAFNVSRAGALALERELAKALHSEHEANLCRVIKGPCRICACGGVFNGDEDIGCCALCARALKESLLVAVGEKLIFNADFQKLLHKGVPTVPPLPAYAEQPKHQDEDLPAADNPFYVE